MKVQRSIVTITFLAISSLLAAACAEGQDDGQDLVVDEDVASDSSLAGKSDGVSVPYTELDVSIGNAGNTPARKIFTNASSYRRYFGRSPSGVDFSREWVFFYSAGMMPSTGYKASIQSIEYSPEERHVEVGTALQKPGERCVVGSVLSKSYVLVKFPIPSPRPYVASYYHEETVKECGEPEPQPGLCADRTGGALITFEVGDGPERFTAWITNDEFIDEAKRLLDSDERRTPAFDLLDGTGCDAQWTFQVDPETAGFADFTIELTDALPSWIEENKDHWINDLGRWTPWGAVMASVDDRR